MMLGEWCTLKRCSSSSTVSGHRRMMESTKNRVAVRRDLQLNQAWECARTGHWPFRRNAKTPASAQSLIPYGNEPEGLGGEPGRGRCWDGFEWEADVVLNGRWRQPRRRVVRCCRVRITGGWSCGACGREARECGQAVGNASALSTGCPHGPQGSRRSVGLVHKSTGFSPCRGVANRSTRRGAQCVHAALVSRRSMSRNSWSRAALTSRAAARSSSATATLSSCSKVTPGRR